MIHQSVRDRGIAVFTALFVLIGSVSLSAQQQDQQNQQQQQSNTIEQIKSEISNKKVTLDFKNASFKQVVDFIRQQVNFNIVVDDRTYDELSGSSGNVSITLNQVQLDRALKIILDMKNLAAQFDNGVVRIVPEGTAQDMQIRFYDVRDLQFKLKDFKGPTLELKKPDSSSGGGSGGGSGGFLGGAFNTSSSGGDSVISDTRQFKQIIRDNTGTDQTWNRSGASMRIQNGIMIVNQTPDIHREILFLINRLRRFK